MQRKDMKEGMEVAFVKSSKLWRLRSGPYGIATLHGDPNLAWEDKFPEPPIQVAKGPGVLALDTDNAKIVLKVRQIAGPWNDIRKRIQATRKME